MSSHLPPLPTFLIIGAQKSATRWLRYNLGLHPDIYTVRTEVSFFNSTRYRRLGVDWYRAQFDGWSGEPIVGEATPGYMIWRHRPTTVAKRIKETVPDVRLIAILRDPVDRANSAMIHHIRRRRLPRKANLLELVSRVPPEQDRLGLVAGGWYAESLRPYRRLFGDQLLVLLHDDVRDDPRGVYESALRHVGAAPDYVPAALDQVVFTNQQGGSAAWRRDVSPDDRAALYGYFRDDLRKLQRMIGRDLSSWKPDHQQHDSEFDWDNPRIPGLVDHFDIAARWIEVIVRDVAHDSSEKGSPNGAVRRKLNQLVASTFYFAFTLMRREIPNQSPNPESDRMPDMVGEDPTAAYRTAADSLRAALAEPENLTGDVSTPLRAVPAPVYAASAFATHVVDGWDVAVMGGQEVTVPEELVKVVGPIARRLAQQESILANQSDGEADAGDPTFRMRRFVAAID